MRYVGRQQWKSAITSTPLLTATTRIALLEIAGKYMNKDGVLVRGVEQMTSIALSPRQLARHLQAAYEVNFLLQTAPGYRGHSAMYQAALPEPGDCQQRRPKNGERLTPDDSQSTPERLTCSSSHYGPERLTSDVSPLKNYYASVSEHVAVEELAADDLTTTALATALALMAGRGSTRHPQSSDVLSRAPDQTPADRSAATFGGRRAA